MTKHFFFKGYKESTPGQVDPGRVDPRPTWLAGKLDFRPSWPTTIKIDDCYLSAYLSVLLMNKTSTNSLIFWFWEGQTKQMCVKVARNLKYIYIAKYFVLLSRNNALMLKGLNSVNLRIISNGALPAKIEKIYSMHKLVGLPTFFGVGLPLFQWDSYFLPDASPELLFSKS